MSTQEVHRHITVLLNEAVAALNIRASILNRFTELGTPQTVAVA